MSAESQIHALSVEELLRLDFWIHRTPFVIHNLTDDITTIHEFVNQEIELRKHTTGYYKYLRQMISNKNKNDELVENMLDGLMHSER
jgi:hypothetical protein